ncbi:hypothetical protein TNCV_340211 [Trichonephila clavipes]|nr:hypothetical protein TNCV_340211 [Trichonephila clavipes]
MFTLNLFKIAKGVSKIVSPSMALQFWKGKIEAEVQKEMREVLGADCVTERKRQNWFTEPRSRVFTLKVNLCPVRRPFEVNDDKMKVLVESICAITVREISEKINDDHH